MLTIARKTFFVVLALASLAPFAASGGELAICGRAVSSEGQGLAEARITLFEIVERAALDRLLELDIENAGPPPHIQPVVTAQAEADGRFRVTVPAPGMYSLLVEAPGKAPWEHSLALFESRDLPTVTLPKARPLELRIHEGSGEAVPGALVQIDAASRFDQQRAESGEWVPAVQRRRADAEGHLTLERASVRALDLLVWAPGFVETAAPSGKQGRREIILYRGAPRTIEVRQGDGSPASDVVARIGRGRWPAGRTNSDGRLVLAVPARDEQTVELAAPDGRTLTTKLLPTARENAPPEIFYLPAEDLRGQVVANPGGEPLADAWVWLDENPGAFERTNARGRFTLPGHLSGTDTPGEARLWAAAPGHLPRKIDFLELHRNDGFEIALDRAVHLLGQVVDTDGRPVAGAEIQAHADLERNHFLEPRLAVAARGDQNGRFLLPHLVASTAYELIARAPGFAAMIFEVPAAATTEEVRLVLHRGVRATGRIEDAFGHPVVGAGVVLYPSRASERERLLVADVHVQPSQPEGRFVLPNVLPGRYELSVTAQGFAPIKVPGLEILADDGGSLDLGTVILEPEAILRGRVVDPDGEPLRGAKVSFLALAYDVGPANDRLSTLQITRTGPDGTFALKNLSPGRLIDLELEHRGYRPRKVLDVEVGVAASPTFVLEPAALLGGRVVDENGAGVAGAHVVASLRGGVVALGGERRTVTTRRGGGFLLDDLEPGAYTLEASADGYLAAEKALAEVRVGEATEGLSLVVTSGARLTGRIAGPDGRPIPGARLTVIEPPPPPSTARIMATSRADGSYELDGLERGAVVLEITHPTHPRKLRELEIDADVHRVDLTLERGHAVDGRVIDASGSPIDGARLRLGGGEEKRKNTSSQADGSFRFDGVPPGAYDLRAEKPGHAGARTEFRLEDGGWIAEPLELRLAGGGTIVGSLLGLEPAEMGRVTVVARKLPGDRVRGEIDWEGAYRLEHLTPGVWTVEAVLGLDARRRISRQVEIEPGAPEIFADLDFQAGLTVRGEVLRDGLPVAGALVGLVREDLGTSRGERSDPAGHFKLSGLEPGVWKLIVRDLDGRHAHHQRLELATDRELRIELDDVDDAQDKTAAP